MPRAAEPQRDRARSASTPGILATTRSRPRSTRTSNVVRGRAASSGPLASGSRATVPRGRLERSSSRHLLAARRPRSTAPRRVVRRMVRCRPRGACRSPSRTARRTAPFVRRNRDAVRSQPRSRTPISWRGRDVRDGDHEVRDEDGVTGARGLVVATDPARRTCARGGRCTDRRGRPGRHGTVPARAAQHRPPRDRRRARALRRRDRRGSLALEHRRGATRGGRPLSPSRRHVLPVAVAQHGASRRGGRRRPACAHAGPRRRRRRAGRSSRRHRAHRRAGRAGRARGDRHRVLRSRVPGLPARDDRRRRHRARTRRARDGRDERRAGARCDGSSTSSRPGWDLPARSCRSSSRRSWWSPATS